MRSISGTDVGCPESRSTSGTDRRLGQQFIYKGHMPKYDMYQNSIVKEVVNSVGCIKHRHFTNKLI